MKSKKRKNISIKITIIGLILLLFTAGFSSSVSSNIKSLNENNKNSKNYLKIPSNLKRGDIVFFDMKPIWCKLLKFDGTKGFSNDHCAMYIGNNRFIEASPYRSIFFGPYKNDKLGVVITPRFIFNLWGTNFTFGYVKNATEEQREGAIKWAKTQVGKPYQWAFPNKDNYQSWHACPNPDGSAYDPNGTKYYECYPNYWYCSELVWAAYLSQSRDLDIGSGWFKDEKDDGNYHWWVSPQSIRDDQSNFTLYCEQ